jgi:hypothetical protein
MAPPAQTVTPGVQGSALPTPTNNQSAARSRKESKGAAAPGFSGN